ncbi:MAG: DUF2764 domain-containing protein [Simkaniaceae bacterium]|nr:DUF2764 domain-containing protein [Simkaniaceae bacterium]
MKYFFLASSLPPLKLGSPAGINFEELTEMFKLQLTPGDMKRVEKVRTYFDLRNLVHLFEQEELEPYGNYSKPELLEAVTTRSGLPEYVLDFLEEYEEDLERRRHVPQILVQFFREMSESCSGFLKELFDFERKLRLTLMCARAVSRGRDFTELLKYEDTGDLFIIHLLVQAQSSRFDYPPEFTELEELLVEAGDDPMEQFKAINLFKFRHFADRYLEKPFSMDALLVYMVQLILLESIHRLDSDEGKKLINMMVKE